MGGLLVLLFRLFAIALFAVSVAEVKQCTSRFPTSHTLRYELAKSKNSSWREEIYSHYYHLNPTEESFWANLLPREMLQEQKQQQGEFSWAMLYQTMKRSDGREVRWGGGLRPNFLREVSLHDVRLHANSPQGRAQQTNLEYLLLLDVDKLLWSFRKTAGLSTPGSPYGGWESPNIELRGHFVGHYLSATAQMWASTHNEAIYDKMLAAVNGLDECQKKIGTGYLSAFPSELFDRVEAIKPVWAPYYTIHKILAGLLDQYTLAENDQVLKMAILMVDYFSNRVLNVILKYSIERHWQSLNDETGGMNDVLYRLYAVTGEEKHLALAHLFDKPCFLGLLAVKADSLSHFHSNTHIPVVIGSQMRYEVTGDSLYKEIAMFFLDIVNTSHTYATGGTSYWEYWDDPKRLATTLQTENEESCTTYNILKVARNLFRWSKEMAYADHYERAILNGILSIQRGTEPGVMIYMLPLGHGVSKAQSNHGWGTKYNSFWCCYGTAIESFSKLGDSIYFEEVESCPKLYIIQFVSSSINWKSGQVLINQTVDPVVSWDPFLRMTLIISAKEGVIPKESTLNLRIPSWTHSYGVVAVINDENIDLSSPGNFLSITRTWKSGDILTLQLPLSLRTEKIKDDRTEYSSLQAILYGPYLLAGHSDGDSDIITEPVQSLSDWISPVPASYNSQLISLSQNFKDQTLVVTHSKGSFSMANMPEFGTNSSVHATYRLVFENSNLHVSSRTDIIGKLVMLEPFDQPGTFIVEQGTNRNLTVNTRGADDWDETSAMFQVLSGLDGEYNTISIQSSSKSGCFFATSENVKAGTSVQLICKPGKNSSNDGFQIATSFAYNKGISEYHPISFVAKGRTRNFLLEPLFSLRDEFYNVYFNITS